MMYVEGHKTLVIVILIHISTLYMQKVVPERSTWWCIPLLLGSKGLNLWPPVPDTDDSCLSSDYPDSVTMSVGSFIKDL
jgi:hypothetical protein